ncbi:hypothetical protein HGRIS_014161 [Hohenbuehelia grisea]|uniref:Uncharacterized protein n=1 Tax=Hohenbuehelia grisea TaxID=104357 RepID=A0ABR3JUM1_9AGAR
MSFSPAGKKQLAAYAALFVVNIIVLGLSARVNEFQEFFFIADLFPLGLSITTLVILSLLLILDARLPNSFAGRPQFRIPLFAVMTIFWLAFNAFSSSRWRFIPLPCSGIPSDFADQRSWCHNVQALQGFVWIEWLILLAITVATLQYTLAQSQQGNKHIFSTSLSRYRPAAGRNQHLNGFTHYA